MKLKWFDQVLHRETIPKIIFGKGQEFLITNDGDIIDTFPRYKQSGLIKARVIVDCDVSKAQAYTLYSQRLDAMDGLQRVLTYEDISTHLQLSK